MIDSPTVDTRAMTRTLNDLQVDVESTFVLLDLVLAGDARALDRLFSRYVNPLRRFAHGRLPRHRETCSTPTISFRTHWSPA